MIKKILLGLLAVFIILQFFQIKKKPIEFDASQDFFTTVEAPDDLKMLVKDACYDCHSHETTYPWYASVQPVGWWLQHHVNEGKGHLNFSEWTTLPARRAGHKLEECYEEVEEHKMPLKAFLITHPEARLSDEQRAEMVAWFKGQYENFGNE